MKITIHGAGGGEVTGSAYLLQTPEANVLVDLGLFQGAHKLENYNRLPKKGARKSWVPSVCPLPPRVRPGRLPPPPPAAYQGPFYPPPPTINIAALILKAAAPLQQPDGERKTRPRQRGGQPPLEPLYV